MSVIAGRICLALSAPLLFYAALDPALQHSQHVLHAHLSRVGLPYFGLLFVERYVGDLFHFTLAVLLTFFLAASQVMPSKRPRIQLAFAAAVIALFAPLIELMQMLTGRGFSTRDLAVHILGVMFTVVLRWPVKR